MDNLLSLKDDVEQIRGVGPRKKKQLLDMDIKTVADVLMHFPRKYEDLRKPCPISSIREGENCLLFAGVDNTTGIVNYGRNQRQPMTATVRDDTGSVDLIFFNKHFSQKELKIGSKVYVYGKPKAYAKGRNIKLQIVHPKIISKDRYKPMIEPLYYGLSGMTSWQFRSIVIEALRSSITEILPERIIYENALCSRDFAIRNIHFPKSEREYAAAKKRLVFEELFLLQLALNLSSKDIRGKRGTSKDASVDEFFETLEFELTEGQKKAFSEIESDMEKNEVMNRLIQGDVGCGKTVIAQIAMYKAVKSGFQAAFMAPTEILAKQHFEGFKSIFSKSGVRVELLMSAMKKKEKEQISEAISEGEVDMVIGTHSLIQQSINFKNLGLVVTDEQHRFGVGQREALSSKGESPDILYMTATPIPRTLALTIYADMDVSQIKERPKGRKIILTKAVTPHQRPVVYEFVRSEICKGRQAYVVTPLIEENEEMDLKSAEQVTEELRALYGDKISVECLHGRLSEEEKAGIMEAFVRGEVDILVATVVIEVGIDVPNATVMIVEDANRFGLAQLHQLRGRVGRGEDQSYCVLIGGKNTDIARQRLKALVDTNDGFEIAEKDMKLRGPGEILGLKQHGIPDFKIADIVRDAELMGQIRSQVLGLREEEISDELMAEVEKSLIL